jgi:homoserine dehydrogenase
MKTYKLVLLGFGNAGQALAQLLLEKRPELQHRHSIRFMVTAVATGTHGRALNTNGLDLERALEIMQSGSSLDELSPSPAPTDNLQLIKASGAGCNVREHTGQLPGWAACYIPYRDRVGERYACIYR